MIGVIFDVDGVIADTEAVNAQASIKMFSDLFSADDVRREDFTEGLGRGAEAYIKAAAEVHHLELSDKQVVAATHARQENFLKLLKEQPLPPFPGVLELITEGLKRSDIRLAIATSSTREKSEAVLQSARIPYTDMVYITGDQVTHKKPHPELFLLAAERIGIEPGKCVVIEDAPNGVQAAKAAGCTCVAVTNSTSAEHLHEADLVVDSLESVDIDTLAHLVDR